MQDVRGVSTEGLWRMVGSGPISKFSEVRAELDRRARTKLIHTRRYVRMMERLAERRAGRGR